MRALFGFVAVSLAACTGGAEGSRPDKIRAEPVGKVAVEAKEEAPADGATLHIGYMHWAAPRSVLDGPSILIVGVTVEKLEERAGEGAEGRKVVQGTLSVHEVFRSEPNTYEGQTRIISDGFAGAAVGDKLILFLREYEGTPALAPAEGSTSPVGIKVDTWDAPIVGAVRRYADGKAKLDDQDEAKLWAEYGVELGEEAGQ